MNWKGVMPAITTCFNHDLSIDHALHGRSIAVCFSTTVAPASLLWGRWAKAQL